MAWRAWMRRRSFERHDREVTGEFFESFHVETLGFDVDRARRLRLPFRRAQCSHVVIELEHDRYVEHDRHVEHDRSPIGIHRYQLMSGVRRADGWRWHTDDLTKRGHQAGCIRVALAWILGRRALNKSVERLGQHNVSPRVLTDVR